MITCYEVTKATLKTNPDREYTTAQMRKRLKKFGHGTVSNALHRLHDEGVAERIRDGRGPFRYSLANTN